MKLSRLDTPLKVVLTLYVAITLSGLMASGILVNLSLGEKGAFKIPKLDSIKAKYAWPPLKGAVMTTMSDYIENESDARAVASWCDKGADRDEYYTGIEPIIRDRCLRCHGGGASMGGVSLHNWGDLRDLALSRGMPFEKLARQTHFHVLGIGLVALSLGLLAGFSSYSPRVRLLMGAAPFLSMAADMSSWWFCRLNEDFAWVIWIGGTAMIGSMAIVSIMVVRDIWKGDPV